jgi:ketopantoate hydroxymethyltransferase
VRLVRHRAAELAGFQDAATARRYVDDVRTGAFPAEEHTFRGGWS